MNTAAFIPVQSEPEIKPISDAFANAWAEYFRHRHELPESERESFLCAMKMMTLVQVTAKPNK